MQRIFMGDVQGCGAELGELIARAETRFGREFELWSVGDLINRGPLSLQCLTLMRELVEDGRGRVVLGNHEIGLLRIWLGIREARSKDTAVEVLESSEADDWMQWLRTRPIIAPGELAGQAFVMVHASAHPDWTFAQMCERAERVASRLADANLEVLRALLSADPTHDDPLIEDRDTLGRLTCCRSIDGAGRWSSDAPKCASDAWHHHWSAREHDYGVVYGHWARQGLHVEKGLRGLDTGCVHHGRGRDGFLTAWLPKPLRESSDPFALPDERFWQVPAHRQYYDD